MTDIWDKLKSPFLPSLISWRVGATTKDKSKGMALAYIDARDVMEKLDDSVGPENWQCEYPHAGVKTVCKIGIKFGNEWIWKSSGAGDSDVEAEKGALSDAFKRAAVMFGVGRYLYDVKNTWVALEPSGGSYKIADSELSRLAKTLPSPRNSTKPLSPPVDNVKIVDGLIESISLCETATELAALKGSERFVSESDSITAEAEYNRFSAAFKAKKAALTPKTT